ncbi:MAG: benzoate/H(+) symporter BenE family transporter [Gammaproteobacteria bacterium]|nr:MAG: hypothetical protein EP300_08875 [Gammaproteobacteria bacterium]UCH39762.1 MAG: benzoate/H(+) symporter BenE family transporter [Gammaproteobacteria bacterium]
MIALAGLALLSTIANSLYTALADASARESAVITFVMTASGSSLFASGSAFLRASCGSDRNPGV